MRIKIKLLYIFFLSIPFFLSCNREKSNENALFHQLDSGQTRIAFVNTLKDTAGFNILDYLYFYNGAGVAAGDINNDGLTDLFFVSNQGKNKLYLNKGNFQFEDISAKAGIEGFADWQTGVTMADVNGDGLLDIYVCAVGNFKGLEGSNELYINNGNLTFTEKGADYGLDFTGFATQAAFFDYDKDGDLDVYLLNHAVHTSRSYDRVSARNLRNNEAGDYLFQNQLISNGKADTSGRAVRFVDVSQKAGIYQAAMGYGLGIVVADLNNDGWEDIYASNDFHEDDYYYLNNGDGTFTESVKNHFRHLSRFSMGCDAADVNNDGYTDLITLDMFPEDETVEKSSAGEDPFDIYMYKLQFGYFNQFSRNCLQISLDGQKFSDVGAMAGVAATDWSWSALLADYDNDGIKDLFVTNGIVRRPNNLDYIKFASDDSLRYAMETSKSLDERAIGMMPEGKMHNYIFQGTKNLRFADKSGEWGFEQPTISNGAAYADLDNDGDLDLITNDINEAAGIYRNNSNKVYGNNYLKINLEGSGFNRFGVGAKVMIRHNGETQVLQLALTRGFLSSVEPVLLFGLGKALRVDTLVVTWPDQKTEIRTALSPNQVLTLKYADAKEKTKPELTPVYAGTYFEPVKEALPFSYKHEENAFFDFNREALIPFKVSTEGPRLAVGDVNGDGVDDVYLGGAKWQPGKLMLSSAGKYLSGSEAVFQADSTYEDVGCAFFDADGDSDLDLYVVSGGNEFYGKMEQLFDRLYLNDGKGNFSRSTTSLPAMYDNKSCVRPFDFDGDGDLDLFVGGRVVSYQYGQIPNSYLLVNDGKGQFTDQTDKLAPALRKAGMVTDAVWMDYDQDGDADLIVVGDWMPVKVFENQQGKLTDASQGTGLEESNGLWACVRAADFDKDGDLDLIVGNLGTNTKLRKREDSRLKMYVKDIDGNQTTDQILTYNVGKQWFPVASKDELGKQLPLINKKFTSYGKYAGKPVNELFTANELKEAAELDVNLFESVYLENLGNKQFAVKILPLEAQVSKIYAFHVEDLDGDGNLDVLLGGNLYGVSTYQGRYDASYGLMLKGDGKGNFQSVRPTQCGFLLEGEIRDIQAIKTDKGKYWLVAGSGLPLQIFKTSGQKLP